MRRFKNILFVFEDAAIAPDDAALERAADLAQRNDATLTLVACGEVETGEAAPVDDLGSGPAFAGGVLSTLCDQWRLQLDEAVESLKDRNITVRSELLAGIPFREIIALVQRNQHDLVVKDARMPGGPRDLLFGSTDLHLMRKCPCPVWVHKDRADTRPYGRIMAAVDVTDTSDAGRAMTKLILDLATSLGTQDNSDVHVVHACSTVGERMATSARRGLLPVREIAQAREQEAERRQQLLSTTVAPYVELPVRLQLHMIQGEPREVLPLFASQRAMDLVIMGTLARTGIPGFFIGNTAEEVLRQVDCSVLTLKPQGFLSPVQ